MTSDIDSGVSFQTPADSPEENLARLAREAKYEKIDMFRRILAMLLQVPKSGNAKELVDIFHTYILDNAKVLKERSIDDLNLDVENATFLLRHIIDCDDCKNKHEICPVLDGLRQNATCTEISDAERDDERIIESQVGLIALEHLVFPLQRDSSVD